MRKFVTWYTSVSCTFIFVLIHVFVDVIDSMSNESVTKGNEWRSPWKDPTWKDPTLRRELRTLAVRSRSVMSIEKCCYFVNCFLSWWCCTVYSNECIQIGYRWEFDRVVEAVAKIFESRHVKLCILLHRNQKLIYLHWFTNLHIGMFPHSSE